MDTQDANKNQMQTMRENFKLLREGKKWSFEDLSQISGINANTLIGIENGEDFEIGFLFDLCRIYAIKPQKVFLLLEI